MRTHHRNGEVKPSVADDVLLSVHRQISIENCVEYIACPKSNKVATVLIQRGESRGYEVCSDCGAKVRF